MNPEREWDVVEAVRQAQRGSAAAFTQLVRGLQGLAVGYTYARLGDRQLAEDAAQEAFIDVHRLLPSLREPAAFLAWFRRILLKHCDRITRRPGWVYERLHPTDEAMDGLAELPATAPSPLEAILTEERERMVRAAVGALPEHLRTAVTLYYFGQRSVTHIADFLEVPVGTVKSRLSSARGALRNTIQRMAEETMSDLCPSRDRGFENRVRRALLAAADGERAVLVELLATDASVANAEGPHPFWGGTPQPLQVAAEWGRTETVRLLLDAGVDPDTRPSNGGYHEWSALQLALHKGHRATSELLIVRGATVDIWSAALLGDAARVRTALDFDASLSRARGPAGATPLHFAATAEVAALLVERGADHAARGEGGWTPLESAAFAGPRRRQAARWLLNRFGGLSLALAAALDDDEAIDAMLANDATALERVAERTDGATHAAGATALHIAAALGNARAVSALIRWGANIRARTAQGHLPMHLAAKGGSQATAEALFAAGASLTERDGEHHSTPLDWAAFFGHAEMSAWMVARLRERPE